jgi:two-component system chemotaxis sensor kinase CheA
VISLVLTSLDRIKMIVAALGATGAEPAGDDSQIIGELNRVASGEVAELAAVATAAEKPPRRRTATRRVAPEAQMGEPATQAGGSVGAPATANIAPPPASAKAPTNAPTNAPTGAPAPVEGAQTIRVAVDVLEELMTLVGELVLTRNQLMQLSRAEAASQGAISGFTAPLQRLSHITSDLQDKVMKTRMQPIGTAWNKLPRLVRDLAQETGKTILLDMCGQDTELDRQVLELMRDPLTHMVRNSADHGLETTAMRRAAGKPDAGRIALNAYHEGGHIIIEISDDGRGIDVARVREKALAKGLATEAELASMTEAQVRGFIFRAGFSTAETVTAISGRGVGMDVVRSNIERIGGTIELASKEGAGSCFTVKIPLTLAIISAVIVQAGGERFAIPQIAVRELVRVGVGGVADNAGMTIEQVGGAPVLRLRDELLPLVDLAGLMRLAPPPRAADRVTAASEPEAGGHEAGRTVVVVAIGSVKLGIVVHEVYDTEEIVVKPVAPVLRHVTMFSGNTILGDGSVIMILDPNGVARSAGIAARSARGESDTVTVKASASEEDVALLLFRAGGTGPGQHSGMFAVPLSLVARLETIEAARIETSSGGYVTQYRGALMKLIAMQDAGPNSGAAPYVPQDNQSVLVFADGARSMGLMVDTIIDVVHGRLRIELGSARAGVLGTAVVGGQAADVLDTGYWLTLAWRDWFAAEARVGAGRPRVLVVDDSDFFRLLLVPALSAAGFDVTAARGGPEAIQLRDSGMVVDVIVSDIEMPVMSGLDFARQVRAGGAWEGVPMVALSAHDGPEDASRASEAGFSAYVRKAERDALIACLRRCLGSAEQPNLACA